MDGEINIFFVLSFRSRTLRGVHLVGTSGWDPCCTVLSASARFKLWSTIDGFLDTGVLYTLPTPVLLLALIGSMPAWHRSDRRQQQHRHWNSLQTVFFDRSWRFNVSNGLRMGPPPYGTLCVDCDRDLGPNLELDTDVWCCWYIGPAQISKP